MTRNLVWQVQVSWPRWLGARIQLRVNVACKKDTQWLSDKQDFDLILFVFLNEEMVSCFLARFTLMLILVWYIVEWRFECWNKFIRWSVGDYNCVFTVYDRGKTVYILYRVRLILWKLKEWPFKKIMKWNKR